MNGSSSFVGMGLMGSRMASRLHAAGTRVRVFNRSPGACAPLAAAGVEVARSLEDAARGADLVFVCVSDSAAVREVIVGLEPALAPGALVVDFSSIDPETTRELAATLRARDVGFVDCPVSGGVSGAESGTLAMMAGGEPAQIERLRPWAALLGRRLTHVGPVGAGQVAKICNQMIVACQAAVLAEVVGLAEANGLDAALLPTALEGGFADSLPFRILVPRMARRTFEPVQWKVRTLSKDLGLATELAGTRALPMVEAARARFALHERRGHADHDPSTLVLLTEHDG